MKTLIRSYMPRLMDPEMILAELVRPSVVPTSREVTITKPAEQLVWEQAALSEIEAFLEAVTGTKENALKRIAVLDSVQILSAVRLGKKNRPEKSDDITARSDALLLLYLDAQRRGYPWPLPEHFATGKYVETVQETQPGPSPWEAAFPGALPPLIEEIRAIMSEP